jgi:Cd2+/Zn2+-exporting ATPase
MSFFQDAKFRSLFFAAAFVSCLELLSLSGIRLPPIFGFPFFALFSVLVGHKTLLKGFKALISGKFQSIELLMTIAVVGAFYLGDYEEGTVVVVLFTLAERLEFVGVQKSRSSLEGLVKKMPKVAYVKGLNEPVSVEEIAVGQIIVVKPYEIIPLDGTVLEGVSFVDESTITGEPLFVDKRSNDRVFAGTLNQNGALQIKVTSDVSHSVIAKIQQLTFDSFKNKAKAHRFIETFSSYYTPFVLLVALSWLVIKAPFAQAFKEALSLLVISCPCALVISTPVAIFAAISNAANFGVLIKGGRYLEVLGKLKLVAFDKTRTITYGQPTVTDVIAFHGHDIRHVLACAAGMELFSEHPLGKSIVEAAKKEGLEPHAVSDFESHVGRGARAECLVCTDRRHTIGRLEFILQEHHVPKEVVEAIEGLQAKGKTVVVVSSSKEVEGVIALQDALREETKGVIESLKKLNVSSALLTGDHEVVAKACANQVGIDYVKAELLPEGKVEEVARLKKIYHVIAMVGDGVNDAPALAAADVGISMTSLGSDAAIEAANIVILNDHLQTIPKLIRLGKKTLKMIRLNTFVAILTKALVMVFALLGKASLALAIFADVGVTLLVIVNSLRLVHMKMITKYGRR